jgi:putative FmdB family regulatory protein
MPVFEYKCEECNSKYEVLVRNSSDEGEKITCPKCNSTKNKKLFSTFAASVHSDSSGNYGCADGHCENPHSNGCSSGMCGLN